MDELIEGRTVAVGDVFESLSFQFSDELFDGIGLKGDFESAEFINNDSKWPDVTFFIVAVFTVPDLGTCIKRGADLGFCEDSWRQDSGDVEVSEFEDAIGLEDVCGLDIPVEDVVFVEVIKAWVKYGVP